MRLTNIFFLILMLSIFSGQVMAQEILTKEAAVTRALENNLGIELSQNLADIAKSNTSKNNTGRLPTVGFNAGYNYRLDNTTANFRTGETAKANFAGSQAANAAVTANYTLFDGFMSKYNLKQLKERHELSQLEVEATMQNVAAQTLVQYYRAASAEINIFLLSKTMAFSQKRALRAQQEFDLGRGTGLAVLNARVDLNNDSLALMNAQFVLQNQKRALNNLMVDQQSLDYKLDGNGDFYVKLPKAELKKEMLDKNLAIAQIDKTIQIGNLAIDVAEARKLPTVGANLSYGANYNKNNSASFLSSQNSNGLNAGLTVAWNIFDGGSTKHAIEQAKLNKLGTALQKEQLLQQLEFDFETAWANYENTLLIFNSQIKNLELSNKNFEHSQIRFNAGQLTTLEYRQAQLNLSNAETVLNNARLDVKIAEVELLLLSGRILN